MLNRCQLCNILQLFSGRQTKLHGLSARLHRLTAGDLASESLAANLTSKGFFALAAGCVLLSGRHEVLVTLLLQQERMDMGENTTTGDGRLDEGVEFVISLDCKLQMAGCDTGHL